LRGGSGGLEANPLERIEHIPNISDKFEVHALSTEHEAKLVKK
jgi:hypothetical protein